MGFSFHVSSDEAAAREWSACERCGWYRSALEVCANRELVARWTRRHGELFSDPLSVEQVERVVVLIQVGRCEGFSAEGS